MPWATTVPSGSVTLTSQKLSRPPRLATRPSARRSTPFAAEAKLTERETVEPATPSGTSSVAQAAAIAAVSIRAPIAPPCTTSPIVASSGLKGSSSTASSVPRETTRIPSCCAWGEFGMNCSMISRRVGFSLTRGLYSEPEQRRPKGEGRARVDAVLLLELVLEAVVEEREQELLPARMELTGRPVERRERLVLEESRDATGVGEVAVLARVADRHRLLTLGREDDPVRPDGCDRRDRCSGDRRTGKRSAQRAAEQDQGRQERERGGDDERAAKRIADGSRDDVVQSIAESVELGEIAGVDVGASALDRILQLTAWIVRVEAAEEIGCDRDLVLRRQLGIEHGSGSLLARRVDRGGEIRRDQGRQCRERDHDAGAADREQACHVVTSALGHQLAGERGKRGAHSGARQDLRDHRPPGGGGRQQRQAADSARDEQAPSHRPRLRTARQPRGEQRRHR